MAEKQKNAKKIWLRILTGILLIVGLALVFNQPIKNFVVNHLIQTDLNAKINPKKDQDANFDFSKVEAVDNKKVLQAMFDKQNVIGKMAIPALNIKLPIFYGLNNQALMHGAGTMHPNQKMGEGNYCLAGHHMLDPDIVFGPLDKAKKGQKIYLTDGKKIYTYTITQRVTVDETQVQWVDQVPGRKLITLVTCASGHVGEPDRVIVRGELTKVTQATDKKLKMFV
ncbi:class A sortase [Ligilactobacillus ceti]|uniref:Sortase n=1 Tax=Ligilactobacillus ceti DSM 22408 TaxID=1122146 RepID=A0A0R2KIX4_9LACO|nr:class A sortase [Ligilactobacillus ceti]KRN89362.1 sortase [Ligilactobacillus ceti DSM 22408]